MDELLVISRSTGKGSFRILGIDPGTNYMGYGVIEVEGRTLRPVVMGDVDLHSMSDPYLKLGRIFSRVAELVDSYSPAYVALESPFFGQNVQSMLKLGRAQGVAMAAAISRNCTVAEYAPTRIKQAIAGIGSASKEQVAAVVNRTLGVDVRLRKMDATDGMAVALCHYYTIASPVAQALGPKMVKGLGGDRKAKKHGTQSWEQFLKSHPEREIK